MLSYTFNLSFKSLVFSFQLCNVLRCNGFSFLVSCPHIFKIFFLIEKTSTGYFGIPLLVNQFRLQPGIVMVHLFQLCMHCIYLLLVGNFLFYETNFLFHILCFFINFLGLLQFIFKSLHLTEKVRLCQHVCRYNFLFRTLHTCTHTYTNTCTRMHVHTQTVYILLES